MSVPSCLSIQVPAPSGGLSDEMRRAQTDIAECYRVLERAGPNIVGEVLRGHGTFYEMEHYPPDDVYDSVSHGQYYYHAHRGLPSEHGHFHTFQRGAGIPAAMQPLAPSDVAERADGEDVLSHLIAISMDRSGKPIGLFTINRWVTGDCWFSAPDMIAMIELFEIDHAFLSWPVNLWMSAKFRRYRPHMQALLRRRDEMVSQWAHIASGLVYEDRTLDITSWMPLAAR